MVGRATNVAWLGLSAALMAGGALGGLDPALALAEPPAGLSGPQRACLAQRLVGPGGDLELAELDAFAVMDVHTGRILWSRHDSMLARYDFQPGSIFKVITTYLALRRKRVDAHEVYFCRGWQGREGTPGHQQRCWLEAGHGPVNLSKALAYSCNLYFARLGTRLPVEQLLATAREFGLGRSTGSDLPGEVSGTLPAQATVQDAGRMAVGQGAGFFVTGLQVLSLVGALANGGVLYSPRLAHPDQGPTHTRGVLAGSAELRFLRDALGQASEFGTGSAQQLARLGVAGKTGTSAWRKLEWRTHGWYMGFWPADRPRLALVVFVHKGFGSREAAGLAKSVLTRLIQVLAVCRGGRP